MITFVTIAASMEPPRSCMFEVLGIAEQPESVQLFFERFPERSLGALLSGRVRLGGGRRRMD